MKIYTLINRNKVKVAKNNEDFVNCMRKADFEEWENNEEFMKAYANRKLIFEKIVINHNSIDEFVNDLQKNNILKIEKEKFAFFKYLNIF